MMRAVQLSRVTFPIAKLNSRESLVLLYRYYGKLKNTVLLAYLVIFMSYTENTMNNYKLNAILRFVIILKQKLTKPLM